MGVLLLYFFSSMGVYRSLYKKINEEKQLLEAKNSELETLIDRYDKQIKGSVDALEVSQQNLKVARDDLQQSKVEISNLRHKVESLEQRSEELYAQVNTIA